MNETATVTETATFAGGCFWCMESVFANKPGVVAAVSGYTGGHDPAPTYEAVCGGGTGHTEAVRVTFDPSTISYRELLDMFWRNIDPFDAGGQFIDRGSQYRGAVFYHSEEQKKEAEASRDALNASGRFSFPVVTPIEPAKEFYPAEEHHQQFYRKNSLHYQRYAQGSGRTARLGCIWNTSEG